MSDKLYVVIPAYNESANIKQLIDSWYPIVEKHNGNDESRLVIINDGSKDDTYELLQAAEEDHPLLKALTKPNGGGMVRPFYLVIAMLLPTTLIIFFRRTQIIKLIRLNLMVSGICVKNIVQLLVIALAGRMASSGYSLKKHY